MTHSLVERRQLFAEARRILIKIGSAVLTHEKGLNRVILHRLTDQIADLRGQGKEVVLVSSGAISCGVRKAGLSARPSSIPGKQAAAALGQVTLMRAWEEAFDCFDLQVAQILLTGEDLNHRHRYLNARYTLETLLSWGVVPIINENDTVMVDEIKFGDNDQLGTTIAGLLGADLVVLLSDIDGLYTKDPRKFDDAVLIPFVDSIEEEHLAGATQSSSGLGTGGMKSKLMAAAKCMKAGIPMLIAPGRQRDVLLELAAGKEVGTLFWTQKRAPRSKKLWLQHLPNPAGELHLDTGATQALRSGGSSLLPIGITGVIGDFNVGDALRCLSPEGEVIGIGLTNYSAEDVRRIAGHHSEKINTLLGYQHAEEVIHRDHFALSESL
jgi:glutamate 5-kinase